MIGNARPLASAAAITLLGLGLAACASEEPAAQPPSPAATSSPAETSDPGYDDRAGAEPSTEPDAAVPLAVSATGDGPIGLTADAEPDGDAATVTGKLIVGPGACLSIVDDDRPQLLVFDDTAEFVLRDDKPSVTTDAAGTLRVGEQVDLSVVAVPAADATGIPDRCADGAADTVLAVAG